MCLAIFKPAKVNIPKSALENGWQHNPDGAGFGYVYKGKMHTTKGLMTLKDFLSAYKMASSRHKDSPFVVHFRIRSQGDKSSDNTHPFPIPNGLLIHNGNIDGTGAEYDKGASDTALFAKRFGEKFTYPFLLQNKAGLEQIIGYNKLVFLFNNSKHVIVNEKEGVWADDVWYSNKTYIPRVPYNPTNNYANEHGQFTYD